MQHPHTRRTQLGSLCVVLFALSACAGATQATPTAATFSVPSGHMRVTFRVAGNIAFSRYEYSIIFNTSRNDLTPEMGSRMNWRPYSAALDAGGGPGRPYLEVIQYLRDRSDPHAPPAAVRLGVTPSELQFLPNGSAFTITFKRSILGENSVPLSNDWHFNAFTLQTGRVIDSMGKCPSCFKSPGLPVDTRFARVIEAQGSPETIPSAAKILSIEFENAP
jgi:hypothetical protein